MSENVFLIGNDWLANENYEVKNSKRCEFFWLSLAINSIIFLTISVMKLLKYKKSRFS